MILMIPTDLVVTEAIAEEAVVTPGFVVSDAVADIAIPVTAPGAATMLPANGGDKTAVGNPIPVMAVAVID